MLTDKIKIGLVDDQIMFGELLVEALRGYNNIDVVIYENDGESFIEKLTSEEIRLDIAIVDVKMPKMSGSQVAREIIKISPETKILALSIVDDDREVLKMVEAGAVGYCLKGSSIEELLTAIRQAYETGIANSVNFSKALMNKVLAKESKLDINEQHQTFLKHLTSEKTYEQIATEMCLSPRTIHGYRDELFSKFEVKTRLALVLKCVKNGLISIDENS